MRVKEYMSIHDRARELAALKAAVRAAKGCKVYVPRNPTMFRIAEAEQRQLRALLDGRR